MKRYVVFLAFFIFLSASAWTGKALGARYISLAPSTTEILFALGLADDIVGVSTFCNYPPAVAHKTKIGDFSHPNMEKIAALKPDYIFCTGLEQAPVIQQLKRLGLKIYVADPATMDELFTTILEIGRITRSDNRALELVQGMRKDIGMIKEKTARLAAKEKKRVFIEIWHEPLMTAARGSVVDELVSLAGGANIAHDCIRPYCNFSPEKVVQLNPQVIILAYMDKETPLKLVSGRFGWAGIEAIKNKKVFNDIDPDLLLRPGPRVTEGLKALYRKLHD